MRKLIFILLGIAVLSACHTDGRKGGSSAHMDVEVFRYDRLQYEAAVLNSLLAWQRMSTEWSHATRLLIEDVLELGSVDQPDINERMCTYFSDSILVCLMEDADSVFRDMSQIEKDLSEGFRALKKELPSLPVPRVYSQISALNQSVVVADSLLGFSLDKYMGANYPLYKRYYYSYQRRFMSPDRIVPDCFTFYLLGQYPFSWEEGHRALFDIMMYRGKIAWVVEHVFGSDRLGAFALGCTDDELKWCEKNEQRLWEWMSDSNHLLSTDPMVIRSYMSSNPNFIFAKQQMPPFTGIWLGMGLIDQWMKEHKSMTVGQLLEKTDFRELIPFSRSGE